MPESASKSAGTCAAIFVMSPVILSTPAELPLPVDTTVILSTLLSGVASAATISGSAVNSLSMTAAWLYSWNASALTFIAFASASPLAKMMEASASPRARGDAAWASASTARGIFSAVASVSGRRRLDPLRFGLGRLEDGRCQLLLAAHDIRFLHLDLPFALDLLPLDRLPR